MHQYHCFSAVAKLTFVMLVKENLIEPFYQDRRENISLKQVSD